MRIAYVTETMPGELDGLELSAARCTGYLRDAGHQVQLVRPREAGEPAADTADEWRTPAAPLPPLHGELRCGLAGAARLRQRWARGSALAPDVVHVTTPGPLGWQALRAARAEGIPASADFRTNFHAYCHEHGLGWMEPLVVGYLRRLHAMADVNFVPTGELARELRGYGFERLQVMGRGVDTQRFSPQWRDQALRRRWQAGARDPVLLVAGRLAPESNVQLALHTAERLRAAWPQLRVVVMGDGPQRKSLQAAFPWVHFAGVQRDAQLAHHYASADVFLLPRLADGFDNALLEAMASGLAVVAFDTTAAAQRLRHGLNGWLAQRHHGTSGHQRFFEAAAEALARWQPQDSLRQQAVATARLADWDGALRGFEQELRALAESGRGTSGLAALA